MLLPVSGSCRPLCSSVKALTLSHLPRLCSRCRSSRLCQELGWRMRLFSFFFSFPFPYLILFLFFKFSSMIEHCFHDKLSFAILIHLSTCPFSSRYVDSIIKGCGKQVSSFAAFKNDPNLSLRLIPYFFVFPLFLFFFCGPRSLG